MDVSMPPRVKKLVGFMVFLPVLMLYFFAAAALGERIPDTQLLKVPYYVVAGIAWAFPSKHLMAWMNAEPAKNTSAPDRD